MVWAGINMQGITDPYVIQNGSDGCKIHHWDFRCASSPIHWCYTRVLYAPILFWRTTMHIQTLCHKQEPADSNSGENRLVSKAQKARIPQESKYEKAMPSSNLIKWSLKAILKRISGTLLDFSEKPHMITCPCYPDLLPLPCSKRCSASIVCKLIHFFVTKKLISNEQIFRIKANTVSMEYIQSYKWSWSHFE